MSKTVGIRELKNNTSRIVERVEAGEAITVTRHGKPVATMVSSARSPGMAALIANGTVRPGTGSRHLPKPFKLRGPGPTAAEYVSEGLSLSLYLDTSALVKLLVDEPGSEVARDAYRRASLTSASALGYVEAISALTRSRNGGRITSVRLLSAVEDLRDVWDRIDVHAVTTEVIQDASRAVSDHGLRAYDGLHLATALALARVEQITFACWDRELRDAAKERGIPLLPERL